MSLAHQIAIIYVVGKGHLDDVSLAQVKPFEEAFHKFIEEKYPDILHEVERTKELSETIAKRLDDAAGQCKQQQFMAGAK
jgi:F-type H+-transporting ATPase subunit alpha